MLPTIRGLQDRDRDDGEDQRAWRAAGPPRPPSFPTYDETRSVAGPGMGPGLAPLPPLRSTLSFRDRDDDAWSKRGPPPPVQPLANHVRPPLDLFVHLPLSSSASGRSFREADPREQVGDDAMEQDDDGRYYSSASHAYHHTPPPHHHHQPHASARQEHHDSRIVPSGGTTNGAVAGAGGGSAEATSAAKRRSRRMSNSERGKLYRSRRKDYVQTLEDQVEALKQQLEEMRVKGNSASPNAKRPASPYDTLALSRDRSRAGLARIVCEYFTLFQFGVPVGSDALPQSPSDQQLQVAQSPRLLNFLQTLVDPNMRFGENFGVQMLLEQWQRYSAYHGSLQFQLDSLEVVSDTGSPLITATAKLRVRFTRTTIEKIFPHVLWNEELVQQLIGREIEYPVGNKFYFGPDGKIKRYETEVDFVTAFTKELGNVGDAMRLVGNAMIEGGSRIVDYDNDDVTARSSFRAGGESHSPTGSQGSASSSRGSVHSQNHSPQFSPAEPRPQEGDRPTSFKQKSGKGAEEDGYGDRTQSMANQFARLNHPTRSGYYDDTAVSRPYAHEYPNHQEYADRDMQYQSYEDSRHKYEQGHYNATNRDAMDPNSDRRRDRPAGYK